MIEIVEEYWIDTKLETQNTKLSFIPVKISSMITIELDNIMVKTIVQWKKERKVKLGQPS